MESQQRWCDNVTCRDYGRVGAGNIKVFSHIERRLYCATCRRTFSADKHTSFETLRCPRATVLEALALLAERNSLRAAARLTHHSPNRVLHWLALAGPHGASVSAALVRDLHLTQVQIDELGTFVKKSKLTADRKTPRTSATCGSGAPWPCPATPSGPRLPASRRRGAGARQAQYPPARPGDRAGLHDSPRPDAPS